MAQPCIVHFPRGAVIDSVLAWILLGILQLHWRMFYIATSLVPLCVAQLTTMWVPESPNFLLVRGHRAAFQLELCKFDFGQWHPPADLAFHVSLVDAELSLILKEAVADAVTLQALLRGPWKWSLFRISAVCWGTAFAWYGCCLF